MEIKILKESKDEIEFEIDNLTLAEILRVYLKQGFCCNICCLEKRPSNKKSCNACKNKRKNNQKGNR